MPTPLRLRAAARVTMFCLMPIDANVMRRAVPQPAAHGRRNGTCVTVAM